jgi:hypothetical protein
MDTKTLRNLALAALMRAEDASELTPEWKRLDRADSLQRKFPESEVVDKERSEALLSMLATPQNEYYRKLSSEYHTLLDMLNRYRNASEEVN